VQTRRLAVSFETFTGSVEHTEAEKFPRKATCVLAFFSENLQILLDTKELNENIQKKKQNNSNLLETTRILNITMYANEGPVVTLA